MSRYLDDLEALLMTPDGPVGVDADGQLHRKALTAEVIDPQSTLPDGEEMSIYEAAIRYREESGPLLVLAGKEYGSGSSRDWAAKGTAYSA